jgi:hypothetical protein
VAVPDPTPGPTQAPNAPNVGAGADSVLNQFASSTPTGSSAKPSTAFEEFGPFSGHGQSWAYNQGIDITPQQHGPAITRSVNDMTNDFYNWTEQQKMDFRSKLSLVDKTALTAPDSAIATAWGDYVQQSANYFAAGATVSPWDILSKDIASRGGSGLAGTKTQTTRDVNLTSAPDAQAIFHSAAQSLLGRNATPDEEAAFKKVLNEKEQANPVTSTINTTTDASGNVINTSRTSTGGVSSAAAQLQAEQQARQNPEYASYQAATTYYNAMMQTLSRGY